MANIKKVVLFLKYYEVSTSWDILSLGDQTGRNYAETANKLISLNENPSEPQGDITKDKAASDIINKITASRGVQQSSSFRLHRG